MGDGGKEERGSKGEGGQEEQEAHGFGEGMSRCEDSLGGLGGGCLGMGGELGVVEGLKVGCENVVRSLKNLCVACGEKSGICQNPSKPSWRLSKNLLTSSKT